MGVGAAQQNHWTLEGGRGVWERTEASGSSGPSHTCLWENQRSGTSPSHRCSLARMTDSDPITRLNAALEGRYRIERELGEESDG